MRRDVRPLRRRGQFNHCADAILDRHSYSPSPAAPLRDHFACWCNSSLRETKGTIIPTLSSSSRSVPDRPLRISRDTASASPLETRARRHPESQHWISFANAIDLLQQPALFINLIKQLSMSPSVVARRTAIFNSLSSLSSSSALEELMQRRTRQANGYRRQHLAKDADKVAALQRQ